MAFFEILNEEKQERMLERKILRDSHNPFDLPINELKKNYRITKEMALCICRELEADLAPSRQNPFAVPVHIKVQYLAGGGYQKDVGQDQNLALAQTTTSKHFRQVIDAINQRLKPKWIKFPGSESARASVAAGFTEKFGVPNVLGAVDCTHVSIFPPKRPHGLQYMNRKGTHTINVQLVADDVHGILLHVNAQYPGKVHDQFIFNNSNLKAELQRLHANRIGEYFLLGDSGYALEPWLMTPVLHATPYSPEDRYTKWHCRVRNVVERSNGYLKGSWRSLGSDRCLHYKPEMASKIIYAACTIYNMMKFYRTMCGAGTRSPNSMRAKSWTEASNIITAKLMLLVCLSVWLLPLHASIAGPISMKFAMDMHCSLGKGHGLFFVPGKCIVTALMR